MVLAGTQEAATEIPQNFQDILAEVVQVAAGQRYLVCTYLHARADALLGHLMRMLR